MTTTASLNSLSFFGGEITGEQLDQIDGALLPLLLGYGLICFGLGVGAGYVLAQ